MRGSVNHDDTYGYRVVPVVKERYAGEGMNAGFEELSFISMPSGRESSARSSGHGLGPHLKPSFRKKSAT